MLFFRAAYNVRMFSATISRSQNRVDFGNSIAVFAGTLHTLCRGEAEPLVCLDGVLLHTHADCLHQAEVVLGTGLSLHSSLAIPFDRLYIVFLYTLAGCIYQAKKELGTVMSSLSSLAEPLDRLRIVFLHTPAINSWLR